MPNILQFLFSRILHLAITLFLVSVVFYGIVCTYPPETRAMLYFPKYPSHRQPPNPELIIQNIIASHGLDQPFPVQYARWVGNLVRGEWGWSISANDNVLSALLRLTPATAELALYSVLLFVPLGLLAGVRAGARAGGPEDGAVRLAAFIATSIPPFILAILLMATFYVALHWFPIERLSDTTRMFVLSPNFHLYTGLITIDGLLNSRPDISLEALRHLVLPVVTLSAFHWATLTRITRAGMVESMGQDYILAARARGLPERRVEGRHAFRNALLPAVNSCALSAASLLTGVFIVERIYNFKGVTELIRRAVVGVAPDVPAVLGFSLYAVLGVLLLMTVLDFLQAALDPRYRAGAQV